MNGLDRLHAICIVFLGLGFYNPIWAFGVVWVLVSWSLGSNCCDVMY